MTVQQEVVLPAIPPTLPPGWSRHLVVLSPAAAPVAPVPPPLPVPPAAAVLLTVTAASGVTVTIHRAEYDAVDALGEYTTHGYAWRCPACQTLETGYTPKGFGQCLSDARNHDCGADDD